jgi:hypothetical protein
MRAHRVKLPAAKRTSSGATLDFKGVDTANPRYKAAVSACASRLLGRLHVGTIKIGGILVTGVKGPHLKGIHIGKIEVPGIKVPGGLHLKGITVPPVKVTTPAPAVTPPTGEPET